MHFRRCTLFVVGRLYNCRGISKGVGGGGGCGACSYAGLSPMNALRGFSHRCCMIGPPMAVETQNHLLSQRA